MVKLDIGVYMVRNVICPICNQKNKVNLVSRQKVRRCEDCGRTIRVLLSASTKKKGKKRVRAKK